MTHRRWFFTVLMTLLVLNANALSQPHAPVVTMSIALPGHPTQELSAPESGLARMTLKDGSEYGFRPTIHDSSPWNRITVTIFKMATANAPTATLGEVDLRKGGPAVESKTSPAFRIAVLRVAPPHGAGCLFPSTFDFSHIARRNWC